MQDTRELTAVRVGLKVVVGAAASLLLLVGSGCGCHLGILSILGRLLLVHAPALIQGFLDGQAVVLKLPGQAFQL